MIRIFLTIAVSLLLAVPGSAKETKPRHPASFSKAKRLAAKIHEGREVTIYCGCDYTHQGKKLVPDWDSCGYRPRIARTKKGKPNARAIRIEWEHVMPAWVFGHQRQCWQQGGRKVCKKDPEFARMEADLHNLAPAVGELNGDRSNYRFAMIDGEPRAYGRCDFEVDFKGKRAEPPPNVRGDIARVYFYMRDRYRLRLSKQQTQLLNDWNKQDPIDEWERERDLRIERVQGTGNPYVRRKVP
jgi:deoxyribonuclease I